MDRISYDHDFAINKILVTGLRRDLESNQE